VLGGELIVQMDAQKDVVSANGEILPDLKLDITPRLDVAVAQEVARRFVAKGYGLSADDLTASEPELWVYNPILLKPGLNLSSLVWRMDVYPADLRPIDELVLVDAHLGAVVLHFNQIDAAKNRKIYDNRNDRNAGLPGYGPVRTEGQPATGITDVDEAYDVTVQGVEVELLRRNRGIAWEQGWGWPPPVGCVTSFGEIIEHVAILLPQSGDDCHDALGKTTSAFALGAEATITPQHVGTDSPFGQVVGRFYAFHAHEGP
jgi:hypothetical protein